jgi:hypothetical protein
LLEGLLGVAEWLLLEVHGTGLLLVELRRLVGCESGLARKRVVLVSCIRVSLYRRRQEWERESRGVIVINGKRERRWGVKVREGGREEGRKKIVLEGEQQNKNWVQFKLG